jgi:hypothetical protein
MRLIHLVTRMSHQTTDITTACGLWFGPVQQRFFSKVSYERQQHRSQRQRH